MARYSKTAYVEIGTALRMLAEGHGGEEANCKIFGKIVETLADIFERDNPRFVREQFLKAVRIKQPAT